VCDLLMLGKAAQYFCKFLLTVLLFWKMDNLRCGCVTSENIRLC
jgi:hypothetical protein